MAKAISAIPRANAPPHAPARLLDGHGNRRELVAVAAIAAYLFANLIHASRVLPILWGGAFQFSFLIQLLVVAGFSVAAVRRRDLWLVGAVAAITAWLLLSHLLFAARAHAAINVNVLLTYLPLLAFVPLYEAETTVRRMTQLMLGISIGYLLFYVSGFRFLAAAGAGSSAVLGAHDGEGSRVFLAVGHAAFVAFHALAARHWHPGARISLILLALVAFWLSESRTVAAVFVLVFALAAARLLVNPVRLALFAAVMTVAGLLLLGLVVPGWNPFHFMTWDDSAYARANEYEIATRLLADHLLFGVGTPGVPGDLQHYVGAPRFEPLYGSDLGAIGPLLDFGLPGLIGFLAAIYVAIVPDAPVARPDVTALKLTCIVLAIVGIISPVLLFDASSIFFWLLVTTGWRRGLVRRRA